MRAKKLSAVLLSTILITGIFSVGGTYAYLTDQTQVVNPFTIGNVTIDLTEPNFDPEDNTKIVPGDIISKDPKITNTGNVDAFVYLKVEVPRKSLRTASSDGTLNAVKNQDLFTYISSDSWILIDSETTEDSSLYTYVYNQILPGKESTDPLFETVTLANIVENELSGKTLSMPISAYAIQADHTGGEGTFEEQARHAYEIYLKQNTEPGTADTAEESKGDPS